MLYQLYLGALVTELSNLCNIVIAESSFGRHSAGHCPAGGACTPVAFNFLEKSNLLEYT